MDWNPILQVNRKQYVIMNYTTDSVVDFTNTGKYYVTIFDKLKPRINEN